MWGLAVLAAASPSCVGPKANVRYVVPDGYRGLLAICVDRPGGETVWETGEAFTFVFPADGVIRLRDRGPFFSRPYRNLSEYAGGGPIRFATYADALPESEVAFWELSNDDAGVLWYYVGDSRSMKRMATREERTRFADLHRLGRSGGSP
jgi:hypothetical protein